jgi:hypothetical protein
VATHQLASLLLDRSCPRPASLRAAGAWWETTVDGLSAGRLLPEGVWCAEEEPLERLPEDAARQRLAEVLGDLPDDLPPDPGKREHVVTGLVMNRLRGRVPGRTVRQWVQEALA